VNPLRAVAGRRAVLMLALVAGLFAAVPLLRRTLAPRPTAVDLRLHDRPRELPELRFTDGKGTATSLVAFRGRVVLLNVWATWCPPCREEMPTLDRLQATLGGPGFEVVALSIDQGGLPVVQAFFDQVRIKHLQPYLDTFGDASSSLSVGGVPLTLLIDRDGREIGRKLGPAVWDSPQMVELIRDRLRSPFKATDISSVTWGRDFRLTDHHGQPKSLADFKGKVVLLFFGFTHCPDICPTTLADMAKVVGKLGKDGDRVQGLFVTVDPKRDTPPTLAKYVTAFNPGFLGLYGDEAGTAALAKEFKAYVAAQPADAHGHYSVDHTSAIYVYDPRGRLRLLMGPERTVDSMVADISLLLKE